MPEREDLYWGRIVNREFPFLHRIASLQSEAQLVETNHDDLRKARFLDGRERFWSRELLIGIDELETVSSPARLNMILHPGFCGSTLLARLLDIPGAVFVLKEPQALADLASQYPILNDKDRQKADAAIRVVVSALSGSAPIGEQLLIKPSCWANPMLPVLARQDLIGKLVYINIEPEDYLVATFRGGRERLAYCMNMAALFAQYGARQETSLKAAMAADSNPLGIAARTIVLLHRWHMDLYDMLTETLGSGIVLRVNSQTLLRDPMAVRSLAIEHFCPSSETLPPKSASAILAEDAKAPDRQFSSDEEAQRNSAVLEEYASLFGSALEWVNDHYS